VHALEDMVSDLKKKPELSGNDFLPMVLKLDELLAHLRGVREMASRLTTLKDTVPPAPAPESHASPTRSKQASSDRPAGKSAEDLSPTLHALAERLAKDHHKRFKLTMNGLSEVPGSYITTVKDCVIQMLRNSAVHGIEASDVRRAQTKDDVGVVRVDFRKSGDGYELVFEDDGAGISPDQLKAAAVRKQILTEEEALAMDTRAAMALIFRPGFSTQEEVSMDAGRGVGMDVVARSVYALGGKIGVSTNPGKFTRFKIVLPAAEQANAAVAV
jgi:two-component system, chemotaxis family, sensor kinase CheA